LATESDGGTRGIRALVARLVPRGTYRRTFADRLLRRNLPSIEPGPPTAEGVAPVRLDRRLAIAEVAHYIRTAAPVRADQPVLLGHCTVCGEDTAFLFQEGSVPRESLNCVECMTSSRYRALALGVLRAIDELTGIRASSLAELPATAEHHIELFDTQPSFYWPPGGCYPLPDVLAQKNWITVHTSSYKPDQPWGSVLRPGETNQNLEALTFPDSAFDIVMTSDVMEHVRLYERAHSEIARVLKPGGCYLFTVPHSRTTRETLVRVEVRDPNDPSSDVFLLEPEYHFSADPGESGVLSYRVFGTSIDEELEELGLSTDYQMLAHPEVGVLRTELFFCRKRPS
jgi:SAM-dependent methyltransferase